MAVTITTTAATNILSHSVTSGGLISGGSGEFVPLVDRILKNKFQLYNRSRQKLKASIFSKSGLTPFQLFIDSKQSDKKFIIGGIRHTLTENRIDIDLLEYDNTTVITLNG